MNVLTVVKGSPIVFPLACLAAVALMFISEGSYVQSVRALDELAVIQGARARLRELQLAIVEVEAGQRGYLLTAGPENLQTYRGARIETEQALAALDGYYRSKPDTTPALARLHTAVEGKLVEMARTISLHDAGETGAAMDLVRTDLSRQRMLEIRTIGLELIGDENDRFTLARAELNQTLLLSRIGLAALSAIGLLALYLFLRHNSAAEKHEKELKRLVQAERDRLEDEVASRTAQLTALTLHLQNAREDERNRLARNLHDDLGALLTSAKLDAARIRSRLAGTGPEALERLAHLVDTLNSGIALGRRIIEDLRPSTLGNLGLVATLEILAREFGERSGIVVQCDFAPVVLEPDAELMIFRLMQEAVTNITKYAKARHVWLSLRVSDGRVQAQVRDDGVGFDMHAPQRSVYGLMGMRFRVEAEGGTLVVGSAPGRGTTISVSLPEALQAAAA